MKIEKKNKSLKIAMLIRNYSPYGGGAERYCFELSKNLSELHEVHIFCQTAQETLSGIHYHFIPKIFNRPRYINQLLFSFNTKKLTKSNFDIVHSHDMLTHANIYTLHVQCFKTSLLKLKRIKRLFGYLGVLLSPRKISYLWLEKQEMKTIKNRYFIAVSNYLATNIIDNYPDVKDKILISYPGIIPQPNKEIKKEKFKKKLEEKYGIKTGSLMLLFVAHGYKRKGLQNIIYALEKLNNNDISLLVVGQGDKNEISFSSEEVQNRTFFLGLVKKMEEIYSASDIFIHPTLGDTFAMSPLEAMSFKIPVIISNKDYCGLTEQLTNSEALILKDPKDFFEIAEKINLLQNDADFAKRIGNQGFKKSQSLSWSKTTESTLKAYEKITSQIENEKK